MKKIKILLTALLMIVVLMVQGQERKISGKVIASDDALPIAGVNVIVKGYKKGTITDVKGYYELNIPQKGGKLIFSMVGFVTEEIEIGDKSIINVALQRDIQQLQEIVISEEREAPFRNTRHDRKMKGQAAYATQGFVSADYEAENFNTEEYDAINENIFLEATKNPLSTFSIDVDAASYSNMRRFLNNGQLPPKDAVRIEEMINYFNYSYAQPKDDKPFSVNTEISTAPWNDQHKLVHIGLQGKKIATDNLPSSNLVFLLDVSGSMNSPNKLPLLKSGFRLLVEQLRSNDHVAIVVYAGAAGLVLPSTSGAEKDKILEAIDKLEAGGSTAGGQGIKLAYKVAQENFKKEGNNRVILATDGDFNIGESSNAAMERLIEEKREEGVFLTVLGLGMGNYKDSKLETIADKGNGNYAYIDNILEAKKVLVNEFGGTLFTIAKDVKLQVEFNPAKVQAYRLIGYENRALKNEDFNDDKKDAGELGSGHTVTALYEIIPVGVKSEFSPVDDLKYQSQKINADAYKSDELLTVKFRYKEPDQSKSKLIVHSLKDDQTPLKETSDNFRWSAAVAGFGMLLRDSDYKGYLTFSEIQKMAESAKGSDEEGYRVEFINLVQTCSLLARK